MATVSQLNDIINTVNVALARIEERTNNIKDTVDNNKLEAETRFNITQADLKDIKERLDNFIPRDELDKRMKPVEDFKDRVHHASLFGIVATVTGIAWLGQKLGIPIPKF